MGRNDLEDIAILVGLGIVGTMAYQKFFSGKSAEEVFTEIDTAVRSFLDTIKLPALPPLPTLQPPQAQATVLPQTPTPPPLPPASSSEDEPKPSNNQEPTNTVKEQDEPKENSPQEIPPEESGQLPVNPKVTTPPSGGAIIGFVGDMSSNSKAVQTSQVMQKQGCQSIVGTGDYSYDKEKAVDWFAKVMPQWSGKMKGALGNHDTHDKAGFLGLFKMTNFNSAAQVAPNLTVVFIDTESGITEATLESLTKAAASQSTFVAYVFHRPFITSGNVKHPGSENKWGTIIDTVAKRHGVKLMIAGHNHLYEHFKCGEIHYVTSGAGGRDFYSGNCQSKCAGVKCVTNTNGFLKVTVSPSSLLCQFITNSGSISDSFTIGATNAVQRMIVNSYWSRVYPTIKYNRFIT